MEEQTVSTEKWEVEALSPWELAVVNAEGDEIFLSPITENVLDEEDWKKAYLAAAAPELLAACQAFMELFQNSDMRPEDESYEVADVIESAIKKALGIKE